MIDREAHVLPFLRGVTIFAQPCRSFPNLLPNCLRKLGPCHNSRLSLALFKKKVANHTIYQTQVIVYLCITL